MPEQQEKRALITYRTKEFKEGAKWSLWFQRIIEPVADSGNALRKFYADPVWPSMTGAIEVKSVTWID